MLSYTQQNASVVIHSAEAEVHQRGKKSQPAKKRPDRGKKGVRLLCSASKWHIFCMTDVEHIGIFPQKRIGFLLFSAIYSEVSYTLMLI